MKKIIFPIISIILFFYLNACSGYKPIYSSSNVNFIIEDHSIKGEERLANLIYRKLRNITSSNKDDQAIQSISISIETKKEKKATVKNSAGKILEYEISLNTNIIINDFITITSRQPLQLRPLLPIPSLTASYLLKALIFVIQVKITNFKMILTTRHTINKISFLSQHLRTIETYGRFIIITKEIAITIIGCLKNDAISFC